MKLTRLDTTKMMRKLNETFENENYDANVF